MKPKSNIHSHKWTWTHCAETGNGKIFQYNGLSTCISHKIEAVVSYMPQWFFLTVIFYLPFPTHPKIKRALPSIFWPLKETSKIQAKRLIWPTTLLTTLSNNSKNTFSVKSSSITGQTNFYSKPSFMLQIRRKHFR